MLELAGTQVFLFFHDVKAISNIICTWSRLKLALDDLTGIFLLASVGNRLENTWGGRYGLHNWLRIIVANSGIGLFEVNVYSDWLHVVQWVLFIEGKTKFTLRIEFWATDMFLDLLWVILSGAYLDVGITLQLVSSNLESISLGCETIEQTPFALTLSILLVFNRSEIHVSTRSRLTIEVLFQFNLGIKSSLLDSELLALWALSCGEWGEAWIPVEHGRSIERGFARLVHLISFATFETPRGSWTCGEWLFLIDQDSLRPTRNTAGGSRVRHHWQLAFIYWFRGGRHSLRFSWVRLSITREIGPLLLIDRWNLIVLASMELVLTRVHQGIIVIVYDHFALDLNLPRSKLKRVLLLIQSRHHVGVTIRFGLTDAVG